MSSPVALVDVDKLLVLLIFFSRLSIETIIYIKRKVIWRDFVYNPTNFKALALTLDPENLRFQLTKRLKLPKEIFFDAFLQEINWFTANYSFYDHMVISGLHQIFELYI